MDTPAAAKLLKEWREGTAGRVGEKLTFAAAAARVGVEHPTWVGWENGRKPGFEAALKIEGVTEGHVPVEAWGGFDDAMDAARVVFERRADTQAA
jgi:hypothetical protein